MKLSRKQILTIRDMRQFDGTIAHPECKTMKSLEKKNLVRHARNDNWVLTDLGKTISLTN